jgi:hypothetical protein
MFINANLELPIPATTASDRLYPALRGDRLNALSDEAYQEGLVVLTRVGPFGDLPGLSKTVRLEMLEPHRDGDVLRVPLRWVATGRAGQLFPALDADLDITAIDQHRCVLSINAVYTPPLGGIGAGIDELMLHRAARATIRSLLRGLGHALLVASPEATLADEPELDKIEFSPNAAPDA